MHLFLLLLLLSHMLHFTAGAILTFLGHSFGRLDFGGRVISGEKGLFHFLLKRVCLLLPCVFNIGLDEILLTRFWFLLYLNVQRVGLGNIFLSTHCHWLWVWRYHRQGLSLGDILGFLCILVRRLTDRRMLFIFDLFRYWFLDMRHLDLVRIWGGLSRLILMRRLRDWWTGIAFWLFRKTRYLYRLFLLLLLWLFIIDRCTLTFALREIIVIR
jgi:hypothetical protein